MTTDSDHINPKSQKSKDSSKTRKFSMREKASKKTPKSTKSRLPDDSTHISAPNSHAQSPTISHSDSKADSKADSKTNSRSDSKADSKTDSKFVSRLDDSLSDSKTDSHDDSHPRGLFDRIYNAKRIKRSKKSKDPNAILIASNEEMIALFSEWYQEAQKSEINDPNAMALATMGVTLRPIDRGMPGTREAAISPSVRMVLMKSYDFNGFTFFTNSKSRKGLDFGENPYAALLFHWKSLRRQVRIEGEVYKVDDEEANAYFASRPREAQIGAWASEQSQILKSRAELEEDMADGLAYFHGHKVPRPPHWWGYRIKPFAIEFWRDRRSRLHERLLFSRNGNGAWDVLRLYP